MKRVITDTFILECKKHLLQSKASLFERMLSSRHELRSRDFEGGDEADQCAALLNENHHLATQQNIQKMLLEIEMALSRIEKGTYGICEETEEPIEIDRLRAIPWTRLSIEGAEIREAMKKKRAFR